MKKRIIIFISVLIVVLVICTISIILYKNKDINKEEIENLPVSYEEEVINKEENEDLKEEGEQKQEEESKEEQQESVEKINQIKEEQGLEAKEDIYEIDKEYDGREVIVVKASIQYKVAVAGMIKKKTPEYSEIDELLKKAPNHTGIWVQESSREKFIELIKKITNANYKINNQGYLEQESSWTTNKYDKAINKMLSDNKLHIIDISSIMYMVDDVTGKIEQYPFEEMDPYNGFEYLVSQDKDMFIISENKEGKIKQEEVLKEILEN